MERHRKKQLESKMKIRIETIVRREKLTGRQREGQLHRKGILKLRGYRQTWSQSDKQRERERMK